MLQYALNGTTYNGIVIDISLIPNETLAQIQGDIPITERKNFLEFIKDLNEDKQYNQPEALEDR